KRFMNAKTLYNALLLSSALFLTACGARDTPSSGSESNTQEELSKINSDLNSIQDQANQVLIQLTQANKEASAKKLALDALQIKLANGEVSESEVTVAQAAYEKASSEVASQEQKRSVLEDKVRKLKEKADTVTAVTKLDSLLNNMGPAVLSGTFSKNDLITFINAVNTKSAAQLVAPANNFIANIKSRLNSGANIKAAFPKLINSPIVDELLTPLFFRGFRDELQKSIEQQIEKYPVLSNSQNGSFYTFNGLGLLLVISFKKADAVNVYTVTVPFKEFIKQSTEGLKYDLGTDKYNGIVRFIDDYFSDNSDKIKESLPLNLKVGDPSLLQSDIQQLLMTLKTVVIDVMGKMPETWGDGFAKMIQEIPSVDVEDMANFKKMMASFAPMVPTQRLSTEAPVSTSGNTSYRKSRASTGGVGLNQLAVDGQTVDQSYTYDMPLRVDLKGNVNTAGRTADVVGSVTYNINGTVLGVIQSFGNMVDTHSESSLLISQSMGRFFIEGQAGFVGGREELFSGWEGQRYQVILGYDAAYVSPFVQFEYRPLTNRISTLDAIEAYVGLESDVIKVQLADALFTSTVLAKAGYESATETVFSGYSLQANQSAAAFVEWNGGLKLSNGFEVKSFLTLGSKEKTVKLNIAFEQ
ncbi:MAG: hypothetical protein Q8Q56_02320, partial [Alphaproteobacteria bacterium]|nr:hypothetical protein [Alphaproteobacteria bacterium]